MNHPLTILYFTSLFSGKEIAEASRAYLQARKYSGSEDWLCLVENETSFPTFFSRKRKLCCRCTLFTKIKTILQQLFGTCVIPLNFLLQNNFFYKDVFCSQKL